MEKVLVLGAGTMGSGIAQVVAQAGFPVVLCDVEDRFVQRGLSLIEKNLARQVEKGKMTAADKEAILGRIKTTTNMADGADVDLVIEAVIENLELKTNVFRELDRAIKKEAILASNTSALSISALAAATSRPEKVIGMHFFNPAPVMQLVEVVKGSATSEETFATIKAMVEKLGKTAVAVNEAPGFIVNRMLVPMINEAAYILMEGVASAEDIDTAMKLGANHPIGPLALADMIGIDVCLAVMETLYAEFSDAKYRPCPLLRKLVRAGYLGRKTGKGFYTY
ncbi:3-hydroxybutyryl-CoA dehydrogenase [Desulfofundulus sp. TPOSR]|uniref:3-hydroxybutyryl-CoA dehydrogenase n=1 Tax=Desulfofundulus sp. TPOSR TaxID=2714340 RepID=UPI0014088E1D|nr:3-hydroxybutyryl-CoA dehydrogenase [Desulfofundulus sp. TPOSR]NHM25782.1 3-hydroxybutyryl-CoA dehydrogenase [Desulfofundulus sp. TPOSR]